MGAIFGFTGPADISLLGKMEQELKHRGTSTLVKELKDASVAYRPQLEEKEASRVGCGIYRQEQNLIAIAGYIINLDQVIPREHSNQPLKFILEQGISFVPKLQGAFVLVMKLGDKLHIARDGAGVRTIYYGLFGKRFFFAIEPKGILAIPGFPRELRPEAVSQYLSFSFIPGGKTMLKDLHELPPGHILSVDADNHIELKRYFFFEHLDREIEEYPEEYWVEKFSTCFQKAVAKRLPPEGPIGIFLSGGIDSSVVVAEVMRQCQRPVKTYTVHFGKEYPNELEFARSVAECCRSEHHEICLSPKDFLPKLRKIIWHLDDPIGDPITVPNFELSRHAAKDVQWLYNGEGGDPCLGGPKNIFMLLNHWYGVSKEKNFREKMYLSSYKRAYHELPHLLTPDFLSQINQEESLEGVLTPFFNTSSPKYFLNKLLAINVRLKGAHLILPKVDRMAGAWGLIPLSPFFDEELIELCFSLPPKLKVSGGLEKIILKEVYKNRLPKEVIFRPKSGMRVPVHFWLQKEMKSYARKILSPKNLKKTEIFNPSRVKQLLDYNIEEGPGRYGLKLWMLITFEIWRRIVIEKESV